jgi:hypothetical protein
MVRRSFADSTFKMNRRVWPISMLLPLGSPWTLQDKLVAKRVGHGVAVVPAERLHPFPVFREQLVLWILIISVLENSVAGSIVGCFFLLSLSLTCVFPV